MSLKIKKIVLDDYRGYDHLVFDDISNLVIFVGPNAVGKTNIIEAIQLLTAGFSFRRPTWSEVISWGRDAGYALIEMEEGKRQLEHRVIFKDNERKYEVNGKKKGAPAIRGALPCVLFTPDDLQLVKASSTHRRDAMDALAVQLSKNYSSLKSNYQQSLRQRNLLLKEGIHSNPLFESWDESLAVHGARLCLNRWRLFDRLLSHMGTIYRSIAANEVLEARYIPSWERYDDQGKQQGDTPLYRESISSGDITLEDIERKILDCSSLLAEQEARRGTSLVGPHKDEIAFFVNGRNARTFASQGQQRTIVLAFKLAAVELVNEIMGIEPVLLLDDVMSELDERHRSALTSFIEGSSQSFITTTNLDYFSADILERATVVHVPIDGTRYEYHRECDIVSITPE